MTTRTHDVFAFASLVTVAAFNPPETFNLLTLFSAIVANVVGSLIPDMDQAGNRLWDLVPAGDTVGKVFRRIFYKHRTLSHSILGTLLIYKGLEWLLPRVLNPAFVDPQIILVSTMIGYISHLVADSMTEEGLPLFFPFRFNIGFPPIKKLRIKTDGWFERYVIMPGIGVYLLWFSYSYRSNLIVLLGALS